MNDKGGDWRDSSAFEELDESWVERPAAATAVAEAAPSSSSTSTNNSSNTNLTATRREDSRDGITGSSIGSSQDGSSVNTAIGASLPPIHVGKKEKKNQKTSGSDLEMLQPGPSSPSLRLASHKRDVSDDTSSIGDIQELRSVEKKDEIQDENEPLSPVQSSESKFSTSSEEKRGSHTRVSLAEYEGDNRQGEDTSDHFGSAMEEQSTSRAVTMGGEEVTFIEHSGVGTYPMKTPFKFNRKDMFTRPELKLKSMWEGMSPVQEVKQAVEEHSEQQEVGVEVEKDQVEDEQEKKDSTKEDSSSEADSGDEGELAWIDVETKETNQEEPHIDVPQCAFTFASPVLRQSELPAPATPSASHGLMRLFAQSSQRAEIEQILNTPRSERRLGEARKLVSELVEQDRNERERKRLRVDERPTKSGLLAVETQQIDLPPRDYVRDAPAFMERLKNVRLPSDVSSSNSRSSSTSFLASRRGAKAPTPETSLLRGHTRGLLSKGQSPRKILRLWSAANQVDEEIAEEEREAEEEEWQDIPEHHATESEAISDNIPIVSIEPPPTPPQAQPQPQQQRLLSAPRETGQAGMFNIGPDDIDPKEMEHMAQGRMTFDKARSKWVPARSNPEESDRTLDESSDPFRDIESFASHTSGVKKTHTHAPKSQSALRNEIALSDTTASTVQILNDSIQEIERKELLQAQQYLAAPNTPKPPPLSHRSPTPRSILKTAKSLITPEAHSPMAIRQEPRSISFADHHNPHQKPSQQRMEKVEELLRELAQLALGPDDSIEEIRQETPTRKLNFTPHSSIGARSPWNFSMLNGQQHANDNVGNMSFLTNASFNVAQERILELITDVAPWEPGWQALKKIDLSNRRVESVVRLKDFLPCLEEVVLDNNEISYLTGLPSSLRMLSVASNRLPATVSFGHLINLESLDISNNHVDESLLSLNQLVHLRHLRAENNSVYSLEGIEQLAKLESINLRGNELQVVNIQRHQWPRLKDLVLSHNHIVTIRGISHLRHLRSLNLDHNNLARIDLGVRMSRLRQLRLCSNVDLATLDVGPALKLRTLYADDCSLQEVQNIHQLSQLDNLSLRQQNGDGDGMNWPAHQMRDIKRLFLSGNAFQTIAFTSSSNNNNLPAPSLAAPSLTKFYSMVYLELSACQLSSLPADLSELVPNLRHLNADYNLFESLPMLNNLQRLKRFSIIGCRISKSRKVVESLSGCNELTVLDIRMNPCTMGLYPPLIITAALQDNQFNKAFLPPFPNPDIARPDVEKLVRQDSSLRSSDGPINKSFFHKRRPGPDLSNSAASSHSHREQEDDREKGGSKLNAMFVASDNRFSRTLPTPYRLQRLLHRGALAMACPNLTWLDGLLVDEQEVRQADDYFKAKLQSRRGHLPSSGESTSSSSL